MGTIQTGNWLLGLGAIGSHAFSGNGQTGILSDASELVNSLSEDIESLWNEFGQLVEEIPK